MSEAMLLIVLMPSVNIFHLCLQLHLGSFLLHRMPVPMPSPQLLRFSRLQVRRHHKPFYLHLLALPRLNTGLNCWTIVLMCIFLALPGLTMPGVPGALASLAFPSAAAAAAAGRLGFPTLPSGHCVMLVSNLNSEVSDLQLHFLANRLLGFKKTHTGFLCNVLVLVV